MSQGTAEVLQVSDNDDVAQTTCLKLESPTDEFCWRCSYDMN